MARRVGCVPRAGADYREHRMDEGKHAFSGLCSPRTLSGSRSDYPFGSDHVNLHWSFSCDSATSVYWTNFLLALFVALAHYCILSLLARAHEQRESLFDRR